LLRALLIAPLWNRPVPTLEAQLSLHLLERAIARLDQHREWDGRVHVDGHLVRLTTHGEVAAPQRELRLIQRWNPRVICYFTHGWPFDRFSSFYRLVREANPTFVVGIHDRDFDPCPDHAFALVDGLDFFASNDAETHLSALFRRLLGSTQPTRPAGAAGTRAGSTRSARRARRRPPVAFITTRDPVVRHDEFGSPRAPGPSGFNADRLSEGLEAARRSGANRLVLDDPCLNRRPGQAEIMGRCLAACLGRSNVRIAEVELLPEGQLPDACLPALRRADRVTLRFQSRCPLVRRLYRRRFTYTAYRATVGWLHDVSIPVALRVTTGIPGEGLEGLFETLRLAYALRPDRVDVVPLIVVPGTYFHRHAARYELRSERWPPFWVLSHRDADLAEVRRRFELARMSSRSYNYWVRKAADEASRAR
jgi:hypothetical protein